MGTTELIANLTERNPSASALDATAVLRDKYDTKIADKAEIAFVIKFLKADTILPIFKSRLIEEQTDIPINEFTIGKKTLDDIKFKV